MTVTTITTIGLKGELMAHDNGWNPGETWKEHDGWTSAIDLKSNAKTHFGAVTVHGLTEDEAVGRRNFILRSIAEHIGKNSVLNQADIESLAKSCGLVALEVNPRLETRSLPKYVGGAWESLMTFARAMPSTVRTELFKLRNGLRKQLGDEESCVMSDTDMLNAIEALMAGKTPLKREPTKAQVDAFIKTFHDIAGNDGDTYRGNVTAALRAAMNA